MGKTRALKDLKKDSTCDPIYANKDLETMGIDRFYGKDGTFEGGGVGAKFNAVTKEQVAIPCGLIAKSFFNDTFELLQKKSTGNYKPVEVNYTNIAWESDKKYKFKN